VHFFVVEVGRAEFESATPRFLRSFFFAEKPLKVKWFSLQPGAFGLHLLFEAGLHTPGLSYLPILEYFVLWLFSFKKAIDESKDKKSNVITTFASLEAKHFQKPLVFEQDC